MDCLDEEAILGFIGGELTAEEISGVEVHARACATCRERLSAGFAAVAAAAGVAPAESGPLARGTAVDRYTVRTLVGVGGMGEVYAAYDPKLDRTIALKLLRQRTESPVAHAEGRLVREAQAIARLSHPNVITVHDVGTHDGRLFLAMEHVEGQTLSAWLAERPRTRGEILAAFREAARGLAAAHAAGLVHRDFKPQNVMVARDGAIRVTDFGLARRLDVREAAEAPPAAGAPDAPLADLSLTKTGDVIGTPRYMAPEQLRGEPTDARGDQFSFCVALYEALYGEHPFLGPRRRAGGDAEGDGLAELVSALRRGAIRPAPARSGVPSWLRQLLLRGLAAVPDERWPSMDDLITALGRDPVRRGRRLALAAASGLALAATAVVLARAPRVSEARHEWPSAAVAAEAGVTAAISSTPPGARVVRERDGATMGVTPFRERWPRGAGVERLRIERGGYRPEAVVVPLERGIEVALALVPSPPAPVPSRARVPASPASEAAPPRAAARKKQRRADQARPGDERPDDLAERLLQPAEERLGLGRIAEGCALGQGAAERAPQAPAVWEFLGRCYMRLARPEEARAYYRKYLALAPDGPNATFIRAIVEREP